MTELARALRASSNGRTKWQGQTVYSIYDIAVKPGDSIEIERLSASPSRAQALVFAPDKGNLRGNGVLMETAAVWTHSAPSVAHLDVVGRRTRSVQFWNCWSFEGVESAWLGNAGMLIEEANGDLTVRCSDGIGRADFDDLVVSVRIVSDA